MLMVPRVYLSNQFDDQSYGLFFIFLRLHQLRPINGQQSSNHSYQVNHLPALLELFLVLLDSQQLQQRLTLIMTRSQTLQPSRRLSDDVATPTSQSHRQSMPQRQERYDRNKPAQNAPDSSSLSSWRRSSRMPHLTLSLVKPLDCSIQTTRSCFATATKPIKHHSDFNTL